MSDLEFIWEHISPEAAAVEEIIRSEIHNMLIGTFPGALRAWLDEIRCDREQAISDGDWRKVKYCQSCEVVAKELLGYDLGITYADPENMSLGERMDIRWAIEKVGIR